MATGGDIESGPSPEEGGWADKAGPWIDQVIEKIPPDHQEAVRNIKTQLEEHPVYLWILLVTLVLLLLFVVFWVFYFLGTMFLSTHFFGEDCASEATWVPGNIYIFLLVILLQSMLFLLGRRLFVMAMGETNTAEQIGVGINIGCVIALMVWGLMLWFTTTEECDEFFNDKYWNLFFIFKAQTILLLLEICILVKNLLDLRQQADYQRVENEKDDWDTPTPKTE